MIKDNSLLFHIPPNEQRKEKLTLVNLGKIGEGGFGKVFKVSHQDKDRALKIINKSRFEGKGLDEMRSEMNIIQAIEKAFPNCSEHILCYIDVAEDDKNIYLLSELMDTDYFDFISSTAYEKLPIKEKVNITYKVANDILDGLKMLHSVGIIHRDLKPENFLWNENPPQIKIADFGLSCFIKECKGKVGSLSYVSPFIFLSKENIWTTRDDIYSLAAVIYSALTGRMHVDEDKLRPLMKTVGYSTAIEDMYQKNMVFLKNRLSKDNSEKSKKLYTFVSSVLNPYNDHIWSADEVKSMLSI